MRLAFVVTRFEAVDPTPAELLARELAERSPASWRTTILATTLGRDTNGEPFAEGRSATGRYGVIRFAGDEAARPADDSSSPDLLAHLARHGGDYDLIVVFGVSAAVTRDAVSVAEARTVLVPFADEGPRDADIEEVFVRPAAFLFGSDAEERLVLRRYAVHRRMRETVPFAAMLPTTVEPEAFRRRSGTTGAYVVHPGRLEPGRGVEELLRYFETFRERYPDVPLELVLFGPPRLRVPRRPDIRLHFPVSGRERREAIAGALAALAPSRLADVTAVTEPFRLGVPVVATDAASDLVATLMAGNGGLSYGNYDEFELILRLGLGEPDLFARLGRSGRNYLTSSNDWDTVVGRCDRVFRSFARPELGAYPEARVAASPDDGDDDAGAAGESDEEPDDVAELSDDAPPTGDQEIAGADGPGTSPDATSEDRDAPPDDDGTGLTGFFSSSIRR